MVKNSGGATAPKLARSSSRTSTREPGPRSNSLRQRGVRHWRGLHSLLEKAVEELAPVLRRTPVEPECELVEVVLKMLTADRALVGPENPALEQRGYAVNTRQELVSPLPLSADDSDLALVPKCLQAVVGVPAVGVHNTPGFDRGDDEAVKAQRRSIRNVLQPNAADTATVLFCSHCDERFLVGFPAGNAFFEAADVRLVDLHGSPKLVAPRANHRPAQLVQPRPGRHVAPDSQDPLEPEGTRPILLACDVPDGSEPNSKGLLGVLEDRPCGHAGVAVAPRTLQRSVSNRPRPVVVAVWTAEALGPPELDKVLAAQRVGGESRFELQQIPRVVLQARHGRSSYGAGRPASPKYPFSSISGLIVYPPHGILVGS